MKPTTYKLPPGAVVDAVIDQHDFVVTGDVAMRVVGDGLTRRVRIIARAATTVTFTRGEVDLVPATDLITTVAARVSAAMMACGHAPLSTSRGIDGSRRIGAGTHVTRIARLALSLGRHLSWMVGGDGDGTDYPPRPVEVELDTWARRVGDTAAARGITMEELRQRVGAGQLRDPLLRHVDRVAVELQVRPASLFRPIRA